MVTLATLAIGAFTPAAADLASTEVVIMDCAVALQTLIASEFTIVSGGGGAIHDWQISKEHVLERLGI